MKSRPESSFPWPAVVLSIAAILCIVAGALTAQSVVVENTATRPQAGWVTIPLPVAEPDGPRTGPGIDRAEVRAGVLYAQLAMAAEERRSIDLVPGGGTQVFTVHPWVVDDLDRLWPVWVATRPDGDEFRSTQAWPRLIEMGASRWVLQLDTTIPEVPLVVRAYFYVFAASPVIEFEVRVSYGTITAGQPVEVPLESVRMELGERPHVDYASRKGLGPAVRAGAVWHQAVSAPRSWFRARTIELTGAMLCQPAADPYGLSDAALARQDGPLCGVARGWDGHFLATKRVASARGRPWAATEQAKRRAAYLEGRTRVGDEMDPRPYAQPPAAGTTGDQADLGAVRCEHVRLDAEPEPWAIHDLRFSAQAWLLRPYANREVAGAPLVKWRHPDCETYNLIPYDRLSHDMLGWPKPSVWISGYGPSDSQHRSDNLLYGLYALTRSFSLRDTILDMLVLQSMEVRREPAQWAGIGSPRGWGRPLLALSHAYACGFVQVEPIIRQMVADMWVSRSYGGYPADAEIRWLSDNEGKYGWLGADGKMIRAGLPWQDAVAELGLYAAWCQLGIPEARQMALDAGDSIARWAFYRDGTGKLLHCYAIRYDPDMPGRAPAAEHFVPGQPNVYVYTDGSCSSWTAAALHVLLALDPGRSRAAEVVEAFGPPTGWNHACWWVMR